MRSFQEDLAYRFIGTFTMVNMLSRDHAGSVELVERVEPIPIARPKLAKSPFKDSSWQPHGRTMRLRVPRRQSHTEDVHKLFLAWTKVKISQFACTQP